LILAGFFFFTISPIPIPIIAIQLAEKYGFNVKEIILEKINSNGTKYPIEKAKGSAKKYNEL
jgi:hypothetical protein